MKKVVLYSVIFIVAVLIILPFATGNLEKEELNDTIRANLGGTFIELSDGFTHYEIKGADDAKTIILIHGNALPNFTWDYNFEELVDAGFRVLRYDLYGHGFSDRPYLEKYDNELYARQLEELIEKLEINTPVYLVGTSQGGSISAYFAVKHPQKVEKIVLLAPFFDDFKTMNMVRILRTKFVGEYIMSVVGDMVMTNPQRSFYLGDKGEEITERLRSKPIFKGTKRAILANMRGNALRDATNYFKRLKQQDISLLLIWGEKDCTIPYESMKRLRDLTPVMQYYQIKEASHFVHYEMPEEINPILLRFFQEE
ncbi:MAG: alpha/beta fold hydrolase [Alkaliphilus sp.]